VFLNGVRGAAEKLGVAKRKGTDQEPLGENRSASRGVPNVAGLIPASGNHNLYMTFLSSNIC
jgi:hypothetical protein